MTRDLRQLPVSINWNSDSGRGVGATCLRCVITCVRFLFQGECGRRRGGDKSGNKRGYKSLKGGGKDSGVDRRREGGMWQPAWAARWGATGDREGLKRDRKGWLS